MEGQFDLQCESKPVSRSQRAMLSFSRSVWRAVTCWHGRKGEENRTVTLVDLPQLQDTVATEFLGDLKPMIELLPGPSG